jgi:hypothetical protein
MKYRNGFVSNSSSSSYVVIDASKGYEKYDMSGKTLVINANLGETDFGWGPEIIRDVGSRINFAYLQAEYAERKYSSREGEHNKASSLVYLSMLEAAIKEHTLAQDIRVGISSKYPLPTGMVNGYIDHQSCAAEGENLEIFKDHNTLRDFLFGLGSQIVLDNDNH